MHEGNLFHCKENLMGDDMRKKKKYQNARRPVGFLLFVLIILIGVVSVQVSALYSKDMELSKEAIALEREKELTLMEQKELIEYKEYMKTTDYIEELAREKFGLIKPNETLFVTKSE